MENDKSASNVDASLSTPEALKELHDYDEAHDFLQQHSDVAASLSDVEHKRLMRTIDWHILPILWSCYFFGGLDKQLLNYAGVMGIKPDLKLKGNDFTNTATALFAAQLVAELPNAIFLTKVPIAKWLACNAAIWGVVTACTAAAKGYDSLVAVRVLLGVFEAAIQPCLALISSQYYRKDRQGPPFLLWGSAVGFDLVIGGLLSFAFQHIHHAALASWQILFVVLGCCSFLYAIFILFYLPDTPMQAKFFTETQKVALLKHVSVNKTGVHDSTFKTRQVIEFFRDPQIWLLTLITISTTISTGTTLTYSSQLIASFGFSSKIAALLNMPSGLVTILACVVLAWLLNTRIPRFVIIASSNLVVIIGACLVGFAPKHDHAALLAGIYIINITSAVLFAIYQWASVNVGGHTKRTMTMALVTAAFSAGSLIGPQTFRAKDAPHYLPAKIALIATQAACAVLSTILGLYYAAINKRRDKKFGKRELLQADDDEQVWENLTDIERKSFRYMP